MARHRLQRQRDRHAPSAFSPGRGRALAGAVADVRWRPYGDRLLDRWTIGVLPAGKCAGRPDFRDLCIHRKSVTWCLPERRPRTAHQAGAPARRPSPRPSGGLSSGANRGSGSLPQWRNSRRTALQQWGDTSSACDRWPANPGRSGRSRLLERCRAGASRRSRENLRKAVSALRCRGKLSKGERESLIGCPLPTHSRHSGLPLCGRIGRAVDQIASAVIDCDTISQVPWVLRKAMSAASRPQAIRTSPSIGARPVGSTSHQPASR